MFSEENKSRVQKKLETLEPIRRVKVQENPRCAAVLIVMCYVDGTPGLLYMERSNQLRQHRGEICFPGGMAESSDTDIIHTALRETREEIGLHIERDQVWGVMQNIPSREYLFHFVQQDGAILVTPVVAFAGNVDLTKLILDKKEVESVFVQSLSSLCDPHNARYTQFRSGNGYTIPVFLGAHRIWGLSAIITHMFLHILAPGLYTFRLRHRT
ncbi:hypothetical protein FSP39_023050 [Pinctada imbricata]|uniref:Nudix hydrolase domain-containing protein n=1 Tax=Pinctada imbricata TaxID=66713 RepID=A0AA88YH00_PINIB|nr:hypothetical protein FSP39_023050 [Pinctada imbricata]